jgi:hypothetical protein
MMSGSFDVSFPSGADGEQRGFSPGMDAGFDFGESEDFGFCDISDELAKELGEGWTSAPFQPMLVPSFRRRREVQLEGSRCLVRPSAQAEHQSPICSEQADMNVEFQQDGDFTFTGLMQCSPDSPDSRPSSIKKRVRQLRNMP